MDERNKMEPVIVHIGKRMQATILPKLLGVSMLMLIVVPHVIGLAVGHVTWETAYAVPKTTALPERIIYQILSSLVIYLVIMNGTVRYLQVRTIGQLENLGRITVFLNITSMVFLVLGLLAFFINTNLTAPQLQKFNFITSFIVYGSFLFHFLCQVPLSFKILKHCGSENIIGFRLILLFLQIVSWVAEVMVKQLCIHNFNNMFHCEEILNKNANLLASWILAVTLTLQFLLYIWDFKSLWLDTRIYIKEKEEKPKKELFDSNKYASMFWIPFFLVASMVLSVIMPLIYILTHTNIKDFPYFPSISPDGPDTFSADIYTLATTISSLLGYTFVIGHFMMTREMIKNMAATPPTGISRYNKASLLLGILMFGGLHLSGLILVDGTTHIVDSCVFFTCAGMYLLFVVGMDYIMRKTSKVQISTKIRIMLTVLTWICLNFLMVTKFLASREPTGLNINDKDFQHHGLMVFLANAFEWLTFLFIVPFFCTFVLEFKKVRINLTPSLNNTILDDRITHVFDKDIDNDVNTSAV